MAIAQILGTRGVRAAVELLVLAAALAISSGPYFHAPIIGDEADYAVTGREWVLRGALPYRDLYENKPPAADAWYALFYATEHGGDAVVRAAVFLGSFASVAVFRSLAAGLLGAGWGLLASVLFALLAFSPTLEAGANVEVLMMLPLVAGMACAVHGRGEERRVWWWAAGLFFGVAGTFKQVAFGPFVAAAYAALSADRGKDSKERRRDAAALAGGAALPWIPWIVYFAVHGALGDMLFGILVEPGRWARIWFPDAVSRWAGNLAATGAVLGGTLAAAALSFSRRGRSDPAGWLVIRGWIVAGAVTLALSSQAYRHYWIPFIAPAVLLAASFLRTLVQEGRRTAALACLALSFGGAAWGALDGWSQESVTKRTPSPGTTEVVKRVRGGSLFVLGTHAEIYLQGRCEAVTTGVFLYHLASALHPPAAHAERFLARLRTTPPDWIVADAAFPFGTLVPDVQKGILDLLSSNYREDARFARLIVYRRAKQVPG